MPSADLTQLDPHDFLLRSPFAVRGVPPAVLAQFVTARIGPTGTDRPTAARSTIVPLLTPDRDRPDAVRVPVGLLAALHAASHAAGVPIQGVPATTPWPVASASGLASAVSARRVTWVAHPRSLDVTAAVAALCRAFPDRRIAVPVARSTDARRLAAALRAVGVAARFAGGGTALRDDESRTWVTTLRGLMAPRVEAHRVDLVIAPDARETNSSLGWEALAHAPKARRIGFVPAESRLAPFDRDTLAVLFGTERFRIGPDGRPLRPVRVLTVPFEGPGLSPRAYDDVAVLRGAVWTHPVRNRRLAQLARLLAAGDHDTLAAQFPTAVPPNEPGTPRRVVLLAGTRDQVRVLGRSLRTVMNQAGQKVSAPQHLSAVVVTPDELAAELPLADTLVRADAGVGLPAGLALDVPWLDGTGELLVVDVMDRHYPALRRRSRSRLLAYAETGIAIGRDDVAGLAAFLRTRPKGA